jgi:hypothetical protein
VSDRLTELKRQRALMAEHLQWLDREIAAVAGHPGNPVAPPLPAPPPVASPAAVQTLPSNLPTSSTDPAFAAFQEEERRRGEVSKSGCWIVFSALLLIVVGSLTAFILTKYR